MLKATKPLRASLDGAARAGVKESGRKVSRARPAREALARTGARRRGAAAAGRIETNEKGPASNVMKRSGRAFALAASAVLCAVIFSGCGRAAESASSPTGEIYRRNCAACHGPDGAGGQAGALLIPDLRAKGAREATDARLFERISGGGERMPAFRHTLTDEQIRDLVRHIRAEIQSGSERD